MADVSEVVYSITAKGSSILRSERVVLSLELKTVLAMVDGVCPVAQYEPFMNAFMPLAEKFETLEQLGLVVRLGSVSEDAVKMFSQTAQAEASVSQLPRIDAERENSGFTPL
jgi:hypothetical protein